MMIIRAISRQLTADCLNWALTECDLLQVAISYVHESQSRLAAGGCTAGILFTKA